MRGLASLSLETPSAPALGFGGARDGEDFGEAEGFDVVRPVGADAGAVEVCAPGAFLPYFTSGNLSTRQTAWSKK